MLLVQLREGVAHLGLDPYAEADAAVGGGLHEAPDAVGELVGIDGPVAQRGGVVVARIFVAKPSVVHYEELAAQRGYV